MNFGILLIFIKAGEIVSCNVKLKNYMQPLNIYKLQFPIIASDYFRRIMFRILETDTKIKNDRWTWGYGCPLMTRDEYTLNEDGAANANLQKVLNIDDTDILIPSCQWFGYYITDDEEKLNQHIEDIIQKTNLKKYITLSE